MKRWSCLLLSFLFAGKSNGQDTPHLTLPQVFERIESAYPEILLYESRIKSIQAMAEGAKSWMPPVFSVGLERFPYNLMMMNRKDDPMNQAGVMFSAEQMIPNPARLNARSGYLNSLSAVQQSNEEWTKNILRTKAKLLYYHRYVSERKLEVVKENINLLEFFIRTAEERYKYNQSGLSTIYRAQAQVKELQNMQSMLLSQIAQSNIGLNILMNRHIGTSFTIDSALSLKNYEVLLPDTAVINRSDIAAIENTIHSMKLNQTLIASLKRPDFGIRVQHMQMLGMTNQFSLMGMVTIPIAPWSSGMYRSELQSMRFEIEAMQSERETMQLMALRMIAETLSMLKYEKEQLKNYENEIIPAFRKNMEVSLLAYKQNTGSFFVLLDAWDMLLMKQMEYFDKLDETLRLEAEYEYETEQK